MTIKSIIELLAQADATLPDNTTQEISAADVRQMVKDIVDTMSPGYGVGRIVTASIPLTLTPTKITPFASSDTTTGYFTANAAQGTLTRTLGGVAGSTVQTIASGQIAGNNGNEVTVTLFINGTATPFRQTVTTSGSSNRIGFNIAGLSYVGPADAVFELRASAPSGTYTFEDVIFIVQAQPVRNFV
jgi:hypothetical protein